MTLDEVKDGDFFEFKGHVYKKTSRVCGYKIICTFIYNGTDILFDRGIEVRGVLKDD